MIPEYWPCLLCGDPVERPEDALCVECRPIQTVMAVEPAEEIKR